LKNTEVDPKGIEGAIDIQGSQFKLKKMEKRKISR
jgi:hypothetical protein